MAAKQPSINDWSNTNVRGENGIRYTLVGYEKVSVMRRDLIGGQGGGFKSGCIMWLRISPLPMTGQTQMFEEKMALDTRW